MTVAVVDASAAAKWFLDEELSLQAEGLLTAFADRRAPRLIVSELGNVLWKHVRAGRVSVDHAVAALRTLPITHVTLMSDEDLAQDALRLSATMDHPFYDCLYLAAARTLKAPVVTADARLLARASLAPDIAIMDLAAIAPPDERKA